MSMASLGIAMFGDYKARARYCNYAKTSHNFLGVHLWF